MAKQYSKKPEFTLDLKKKYYAVFHTDKGDIKVKLFADKVPLTVNNFVFLAQDGFYDNTNSMVYIFNTMYSIDYFD